MGRMAAPVMACRINSASTVYPIRAGLVSYLCKLLIQIFLICIAFQKCTKFRFTYFFIFLL